MKIALCDDDFIEIGKVENYLNQNRLLNYEFDFFSNGTKLLKHLDNIDVKYSIYFITIEMAEMSGIEIAQQIRQLDLHALIIFISNDTIHMPEVFKVQTFDYLLKPICKDQLAITMDKYEQELSDGKLRPLNLEKF
ncbi:response regulator [Enterococcus faecalis]|uniref:LytR/AlgR family response regulator transcription factor n=1 Tax=Enterococcus faecalis TaxID=1351 RepID=UPI0013873356|nr:response regulator [Enterococcus faecalis]MEB7428041.1 response regulator [Enterococcus faecalis]